MYTFDITNRRGLFLTFPPLASPPKNRGLVLSGGGVTGIAHVGALTELSSYHPFSFTHIIGSSAGVIVGIMVACGLSVEEMKVVIENTNLLSLLGTRFFPINLYHLIWMKGWFTGAKLEEWFHNFLQDRLGNGDITFQEMFEKTGIHFTSTYLSLRYRKTMYANHITKPKGKVKTYLTASCCVPFVFTPVLEPSEVKGEEDYMLDGGTIDNYPADFFDTQGIPYLGLDLAFENEMDIYNARKFNQFLDQGIPASPVALGIDLVEMFRYKLRGVIPALKDGKNTCFIDISGFSEIDFALTEEQKKELFERGVQAMKTWLVEQAI